jgi:hypothetical protein
MEKFIIETTQRTEHIMSPLMKQKIDEQLQDNISRSIGADQQAIDALARTRQRMEYRARDRS